MTLADMSDRCLRIGSAGKTFSLTGWEVGYVSASEDLVKTVSRAHQFLTFTTPPSLQRAVAYGLGKDADYFAALAGEMQRKRDALRAGLEGVGFEVLDSAGTYFLSADFRPLGFTGDDLTFAAGSPPRRGSRPFPSALSTATPRSAISPASAFARRMRCWPRPSPDSPAGNPPPAPILDDRRAGD